MRIRDVQRSPLSQPGQVNRPRRDQPVGSAAPAGPPADRVDLSARSYEVQRARRLALAAPDIREDLVQAVLAEIRSGRYRVTGRDVVPKMIREHIWDARGVPPEGVAAG